MPTYEYVCTDCGREFELFQSMKDNALKTCTCGKEGKVQRKIGLGAGLIFKGSGFYITDYRKGAPSAGTAPAAATTPASPGTASSSGPAPAPSSTTVDKK